MKSLRELRGYVVLLEADETGEATPPAQAPAEAPQPDKPAETPQPKTGKASDIVAMKKGDISADKVIDKLNTIRAGRSFKDPNIKSSLTDYISSLKPPERVALFAFLKGVSQIMSGEVEGQSATEPADPAPSIQMQKVRLKREIKPTIVMPSKPGAPEQEESPEAAAAPARVPTPIKAK